MTDRSQSFVARLPSLHQSALNVGTAWGFKVASMVASLFVMGLAVREYGLEGLALIVLASQVASYVQLVEIGIPSTMSRRLPGYLAAGDTENVNSFCNSGIGILLLASLVLVALLPVFIWLLPKAFVFTENERRVSGILFGLAISAVAIQLPFRIGYGILSSIHKFSTYYLIETVALMVKVGLIVALLTFWDAAVWAYTLVSLLPVTVAAAVEFRMARSALPNWRCSARQVSSRSLRELLSLSSAVMVGTLSTAIALYGGSLALATMVQPSEVVIYSIPSVLAFNLLAFAAAVSTFLSPIASQLVGRDEVRLGRLVLLGGRYSFAVAALFCIASWAGGEAVLRVWLGDENLPGDTLGAMYMVLMISVVALAIAMPGTTARGALVAMGWHWAVASIEFATGVAGLVGGVVGGWLYGQAPLMFALAAGSAALTRGALLVWLTLRVLKISAAVFVFSLARVLLAMVIPIASLVVVELSAEMGGGLPFALLKASVAICTFLLAGLVVVLDHRHRCLIVDSVLFRSRQIAARPNHEPHSATTQGDVSAGGMMPMKPSSSP